MIIYKHTNTISGLSYIGITAYHHMARFGQHITDAYSGSDNKFHVAIREYPLSSWFSEELLQVDTRELALHYEEIFISLFDTCINGYNTLATSKTKDWSLTEPVQKIGAIETNTQSDTIIQNGIRNKITTTTTNKVSFKQGKQSNTITHTNIITKEQKISVKHTFNYNVESDGFKGYCEYLLNVGKSKPVKYEV